MTAERLAYSNHLTPATTFVPPRVALNALAKGNPEGKWILHLKAANNPGLKRVEIEDVILGIEYSTTVSYD